MHPIDWDESQRIYDDNKTEEQVKDLIIKVLKVEDYLSYKDIMREDIQYERENYTPWQLSKLIEDYAENDENKYYKLIIFLAELESTDAEYILFNKK